MSMVFWQEDDELVGLDLNDLVRRRGGTEGLNSFRALPHPEGDRVLVVLSRSGCAALLRIIQQSDRYGRFRDQDEAAPSKPQGRYHRLIFEELKSALEEIIGG